MAPKAHSKPATRHTDDAAQTYSPESWEEARKIASLLGKVPSSFTSCIHFLRKDCEEHGGILSQGSKFSLSRLLKSGFFSAPMYFGAETFFEEEVKSCDRIDASTYADLYGTDGLAIAISLLYLFRRVQKNCDETEWSLIAQQVMVDSEFGAHVGKAIPAIGYPLGVLVGAIRPLASAMFLGIDKRGYIEYKRHRNKEKLSFDMPLEAKTWGCNHAQLGALLLQAVGLGVTLVDALVLGLDPDLKPYDQYEPNALRVKLTTLWIDSLKTTGAPPNMTHLGKYYPLKGDLEKLLQKTEMIRAAGSKHRWLEKTKEDIGPEKTPLIFGGRLKAQAMQETQIIEADEHLDEELEQEIRELEA